MLKISGLHHPTAGKSKRHMQLAGPKHEVQISVGYRTGFVIETSQADRQNNARTAYAEFGRRITHLLALAKRPALPMCTGQNRSHPAPLRSWHAESSHRQPGRIRFVCLPKHPGRTLKQLVMPLLDLVRVNIKILRQFDHRLFTHDCGNYHFCLTDGLWFRRGRFVMIFSALAAECRH